MSLRRRRIKQRIERDKQWRASFDALTMSLQQIQDAINAARARGETTCSERFLREAFGARPTPGEPDGL
jgi:anti-sigma-K factor RskA